MFEMIQDGFSSIEHVTNRLAISDSRSLFE